MGTRQDPSGGAEFERKTATHAQRHKRFLPLSRVGYRFLRCKNLEPEVRTEQVYPHGIFHERCVSWTVLQGAARIRPGRASSNPAVRLPISLAPARQQPEAPVRVATYCDGIPQAAPGGAVT